MLHTPPIGTKVLWETDQGPYLPAKLNEGRVVDPKKIGMLVPDIYSGMIVVSSSIYAEPRSKDCSIVSVRNLVW